MPPPPRMVSATVPATVPAPKVQWYPMHMAPHDGTVVMVWDEGTAYIYGGPMLAKWSTWDAAWRIWPAEGDPGKYLTKPVRWSPMPQPPEEPARPFGPLPPLPGRQA